MESNYFTHAFIKPVIQSWLSTMHCTKDSSRANRMYIIYDEDENLPPRVGIIQFYDKSVIDKEKGNFYGDIMELSIYEDIFEGITEDCSNSLSKWIEESGKQPVFWLHFEMHDFEFVMAQLSDFFRFLYNSREEEFGEDTEKFTKDIKNILICCTAGVTSGYFAVMMQQSVDKQCPNCGIHINNCNVAFLDDCIKDYDVVLITPQIGYMEKELKEKYGDKIQKIDRTDFATFQFEKVLDKILK